MRPCQQARRSKTNMVNIWLTSSTIDKSFVLSSFLHVLFVLVVFNYLPLGTVGGAEHTRSVGGDITPRDLLVQTIEAKSLHTHTYNTIRQTDSGVDTRTTLASLICMQCRQALTWVSVRGTGGFEARSAASYTHSNIHTQEKRVTACIVSFAT
jgi:hypothetical protein